LENQRSLIGIDLYALDVATHALTRPYQKFLPTALQALNTQVADIQVAEALVSQEITELQTHGFHFRNISEENRPPMLAIFFADFAHAPAKARMPVAIGYVSLSHFLQGGNSFNRFAVVDRDGAILFHSDEKELIRHSNVGNDLIFKDALMKPVNAGASEYV